MLLTGKDIADKLNKPPTTIREWGSRYRDYLPRKQKGRNFLYSETSLEVFRRIAELHSRGLTTEQVKTSLASDFGTYQEGDKVDDDKTTTEGNSLVLSGQYQGTLKPFYQIFEQQKTMIELQREELELLKAKLGLNGFTTAPQTNDNSKADTTEVEATKTTKQKRGKRKKVATPKRAKTRRLKGNRKSTRDYHGRFKKLSWWDKLVR